MKRQGIGQKIRTIHLLLIYLLTSGFVFAQEVNIYSKSYGNKTNPAIIFIHGGPSGNSNLFEATTAQNLADLGFYVIVYDRRGEGRSADINANMTFEESFDDLRMIYQKWDIQKAHLLGHSFGGIIATLFTEKYPGKVRSLILAGALVSQQETYDNILKNAERQFKTDPQKIKQISDIKGLSKNSAEYRKQCFDLSGKMNYFNMPNPTQESIQLRESYEKSDLYKSNIRNHLSPIKFYKNESNNNVNNKPVLKLIRTFKIPIYAIYGKDDLIFSSRQLSDLRRIVGSSNFQILDNCSHYLYADQQAEFLQYITQKLQ